MFLVGDEGQQRDLMGEPVDYTNAVRVNAQLDDFISISNAVDLALFC